MNCHSWYLKDCLTKIQSNAVFIKILKVQTDYSGWKLVWSNYSIWKKTACFRRTFCIHSRTCFSDYNFTYPASTEKERNACWWCGPAPVLIRLIFSTALQLLESCLQLPWWYSFRPKQSGLSSVLFPFFPVLHVLRSCVASIRRKDGLVRGFPV